LALEAELDQLRRELAAVQAHARAALDQTHRQYRRDLVPLHQALAIYEGRNAR